MPIFRKKPAKPTNILMIHGIPMRIVQAKSTAFHTFNRYFGPKNKCVLFRHHKTLNHQRTKDKIRNMNHDPQILKVLFFADFPQNGWKFISLKVNHPWILRCLVTVETNLPASVVKYHDFQPCSQCSRWWSNPVLLRPHRYHRLPGGQPG